MTEIAGKLIIDDPVIKKAVDPYPNEPKASTVISQADFTNSENLDALSGNETFAPPPLNVSIQISHQAADDLTDVTLTATGDAADHYTWTDEDGQLLGTGNPCTVRFTKYGTHDVHLVARTNDNFIGSAVLVDAISTTIRLADEHIARCGDLTTNTQEAVQQLMSRIRNDEEMWSEMLRDGGAFGLLLHEESMSSALKDCFGFWAYINDDYENISERRYVDYIAYNNPTLDSEGIKFNGIDQYIDTVFREDGVTPYSVYIRYTTYSYIMYLANNDDFTSGWSINVNSRTSFAVYNEGNRQTYNNYSGRTSPLVYSSEAGVVKGLTGGWFSYRYQPNSNYFANIFQGDGGFAIGLAGINEDIFTYQYKEDAPVDDPFLVNNPDVTYVRGDKYSSGTQIGSVRGMPFGGFRTASDPLAPPSTFRGNQLGIFLCVPCRTPQAYSRLAAYTKEYLNKVGRTSNLPA